MCIIGKKNNEKKTKQKSPKKETIVFVRSFVRLLRLDGTKNID